MSPGDELFDRYTNNYGTVLETALSSTGEGQDFYAHSRLTFLANLLHRLGHSATSVMDFGCGVGSTTPHLQRALDPERLIGVDVSRPSIESANQQFASEYVRFLPVDEYVPDGTLDLVYCNGVFHHILPRQRESAVSCIGDSLRPGGLLALWENNPWNPGTRHVMDHCEFDRDAIPLSPPTARFLVRQAGLEVIRTDFLFIFPRFLRHLRWIEGRVSRWPLGGQYQVLARKPG